MCTLRAKPVCLLILLLTFSDVTNGEEPSRKVARTDRYGDPLPDGATARLGTTR